MMCFTPLLLLRALGGRHLDISPTGTYSAAPLAHPFTFLGVMRPRTVLFLPSAACRASYVDARLARVATAYARQSQDVYTTWFDVTEPLCTLGRYWPEKVWSNASHLRLCITSNAAANQHNRHLSVKHRQVVATGLYWSHIGTTCQKPISSRRTSVRRPA